MFSQLSQAIDDAIARNCCPRNCIARHGMVSHGMVWQVKNIFSQNMARQRRKLKENRFKWCIYKFLFVWFYINLVKSTTVPKGARNDYIEFSWLTTLQFRFNFHDDLPIFIPNTWHVSTLFYLMQYSQWFSCRLCCSFVLNMCSNGFFGK